MLLRWHVALVLRVCMTPAGRGSIPWPVAIRGQTRSVLLLPMPLRISAMIHRLLTWVASVPGRSVISPVCALVWGPVLAILLARKVVSWCRLALGLVGRARGDVLSLGRAVLPPLRGRASCSRPRTIPVTTSWGPACMRIIAGSWLIIVGWHRSKLSSVILLRRCLRLRVGGRAQLLSSRLAAPGGWSVCVGVGSGGWCSLPGP